MTIDDIRGLNGSRRHSSSRRKNRDNKLNTDYQGNNGGNRGGSSEGFMFQTQVQIESSTQGALFGFVTLPSVVAETDDGITTALNEGIRAATLNLREPKRGKSMMRYGAERGNTVRVSSEEILVRRCIVNPSQ